MIGERLLDLRKDAGMTQDELAAILNINKHSISSYERDKSEPPDAVKIAMANYFHVSIDYLLGLTDDPKPYNASVQYVRLPMGLPSEAMKELEHCVAFLQYKYK